MPDIAQFTDPVVAAIYEQYVKRGETEQARTYLGASQIGKECERALWYGFRWASREKFDGRMFRLFQTGHLAEPRFVADLRSIGVEIHDIDPATGRQFGYVDHGGHMKGHTDGRCTGVPMGGRKWHIVEFKTHSAKSFDKLKKAGVKKAKPEHYAQMTWYMGKDGCDRALYLAVNKDTDELYSERIEFDPTEFAKIQAKAERIIYAPHPPGKISEDPNYYLCGWCSHRPVCHGHRVPPVSCRTCVSSTPEREGDGRWSCQKHGPEIPVEFQRKGCGDHLPLPFLVTYAVPTDAGDGWILFQRNDDGRQFVVSDGQTAMPSHLPTQHPVYTSREISACADHKAIGDTTITDLRAQFPGAQIVG